jgi:hypothetical protein
MRVENNFLLSPQGNTIEAKAARVAIRAYAKIMADCDLDVARALCAWMDEEDSAAEDPRQESLLSL